MPESTLVHETRWTAQTKRNPAPVGGKVGDPVVNLPALSLTPVMPTTPEVIERYSFESPIQAFVSYANGIADVLEGDDVVFLAAQNVDAGDFGTSDRTFSVFAVGKWHDPKHPFTELILEEIQGT